MAPVRAFLGLRAAVAVAALCTVVALILPPMSFPARAAVQEQVRLAPGATISLATPGFLIVGRRYAFSWPGGGPPQTHTLKRVHPNGWVEVEVSDENVDPNLLVPGQLPTRWLNAALALSIQEMRPLP
jgi:hypothetical protein